MLNLKARGFGRRLLTYNPDAHAAAHFDEHGNVFVFPGNRKPSIPQTTGDSGICTIQNKRLYCAACI